MDLKQPKTDIVAKPKVNMEKPGTEKDKFGAMERRRLNLMREGN